ncbi:hypothetical protein [Brevibacillus parabrevis]|uniref:hypothetical protein n=1 Tax=Brevibacillus parabrevis TaxID=54914 RepID=UPI002E1F8B1F|nr:hypothetical protein [Brevibacillus parabrevis]
MNYNGNVSKEIENQVDLYLFELLDSSIPRYQFIYHINLVYIDFIIDRQLWFSTTEKHFLFSLSYNIFLAYKKLSEEETFEYKFDKELYIYCLNFLIKGMQYSMLCDEFPSVNSGNKRIIIHDDRKTISFIEEREKPRRKHEFINKYNLRKALSYTLQIACEKLNDKSDEDATFELTKAYDSFWNENMLYDDFEPYSRLDWGGVTDFFIRASMKRFIKLYRLDFNIEKFGSHNMMIIISPQGRNRIIEFTVTKEQQTINQVLEDYTYKPIGNGLFPKSNISDAPIIQTKDGFLLINPLVMLFNESSETRFLNYLRKYDNARHQRVKDKLKERVIPIIEQLIKLKFSNVVVKSNFSLPIPRKKKHTRELDLLVVDESTGFVLYIEVKHFFNPMSVAEMKNLDKQLQEALDKTSDQVEAIKYNWEIIKQRFGISTDIKEIECIILSHQYLGNNVEINSKVPIVNPQNLYESLAESNSVKEFYKSNKEIDEIYNSIKIKSSDINFEYSTFNFSLKTEVLDPEFEMLYLSAYRKNIMKTVNLNRKSIFQSTEEAVETLFKELHNKY